MIGLVSLAKLLDKVFFTYKRKNLPQEVLAIRTLLDQAHCVSDGSCDLTLKQIQSIAKHAKYEQMVVKSDVITPFIYHLIASSTLQELKNYLDSKLFDTCLCEISKAIQTKRYDQAVLQKNMDALLEVNDQAFLKLRELCFAAKLPLQLGHYSDWHFTSLSPMPSTVKHATLQKA